MGFLKDWIYVLLVYVLDGYNNAIEQCTKILSGEHSFFSDGDVWDKVVGFSDVLKPFCYTIIGICLLLELANVASRVDIIKWEHALKVAIKIALAKAIIDIAPDFLYACYRQASSWIVSMNDSTEKIDISYMQRALTNQEITGFWQPLILLMLILIPFFVIKLCEILILAIAWGRIFEIYCLLAIFPLPCSFFPLGDGSGGGFSRITKRYFLNFISVCLHGVMIIVAIKVYGILMNNIFQVQAEQLGDNVMLRILGLCFLMVLGSVVLVIACIKSGQWAKTIMDVG